MINVMIADDEEVIRRGLEKITSRMELDVNVIGSYGNGLEAWEHFEKLSRDDIDLLITDIKMPRMDGFTLIEQVRGHMEDMPIAVLSGFSEFEYARRAIRHGVMDYLLKPIDKTQLYELLKRVEDVKKKNVTEQEEMFSQETEGENIMLLSRLKAYWRKSMIRTSSLNA